MGSGAPVGNSNALKHGLYSDYYEPDESQLSETVELNLDSEIKLLKICIRRAVRAGADLGVVAAGVDALGRALKVRYAMRGDAARGLDAALARALDELGNELSMSLT